MPTIQVSGPEAASANARTCPARGRDAFGFRLRNQESPTSELPLSTAKQRRDAGTLRVEMSFSLKDTCITVQSLEQLILCWPWEGGFTREQSWRKGSNEHERQRCPVLSPGSGCPLHFRPFPFLLSPATCRFPVHPAASHSSERRGAEESRQGDVSRLWPRSAGESRGTLALLRLLPND